MFCMIYSFLKVRAAVKEREREEGRALASAGLLPGWQLQAVLGQAEAGSQKQLWVFHANGRSTVLLP